MASGAPTPPPAEPGAIAPGIFCPAIFWLPGATEDCSPAFGSGKIGMVDTTRGVLAGTGTSTGFSSRDTSLSGEPALLAFAWPNAAAELPAGTILFGLSSALMIGGSDGSIEPPNIAR